VLIEWVVMLLSMLLGRLLDEISALNIEKAVDCSTLCNPVSS